MHTPPTTQHDLLLAQGIKALQSGKTEQARLLLAQAIRQSPDDDRAWLWLSGAVASDTDRRRCLERALLLNPQNQAAQYGLFYLTSHPTDSGS